MSEPNFTIDAVRGPLPNLGLTRDQMAALLQYLDFTTGTIARALDVLAGAGFIVRTGSGAVAARSIQVLGDGLAVTNGDGVSANPVLSAANDLAAIEALEGTGVPYRVSTDTWAMAPNGVHELTAAGTVDLTKLVTLLNATAAGPYALTLPAGSFAGQEHIIVCKNGATTATWQMTGTLAEWSLITFDATGHSARMIWDGAGWHLAGGNAAVA